MDTRRTIRTVARATVGAIIAAIALSSAPTQAMQDITPVRVLDGVRLHEPSPARTEMVEWALKRYRAAGIQVPPVDIYFHQDPAGCGGNLGFTKNGRVDLCVRLEMEAGPQRIVLHELAHAWATAQVDQETRARFMRLRTLPGWNVTSDDWKDRGTEQAAEIIAWGLGEDPMFPMITGDREPAWLADGFLVLTGTEPVNGLV